jgi:hypothetical protein
VLRIRALKRAVAERTAGRLDSRLRQAAEALVAKVSTIEEELYQVRNRSPKDPLNFPVRLNNRISALQRVVESAEAKPTDQCYTVFELLSADLAAQLAALDAAVGTDLPALNRLLAARSVAAIVEPGR